MEMGFSSHQLIEIGLNVAGFLAAGTLLLLMRSLFAGRRGHALQTATPSAGTVGGNVFRPEPTESKTPSNVEFVDLRGVEWNPHRSGSTSGSKSGYKNQNRREIIRLAQEMIKGVPMKSSDGESPCVPDKNGVLVESQPDRPDTGRNE
jgi:hypothetical protein